jgi:AraC family transcriptional regulator
MRQRISAFWPLTCQLWEDIGVNTDQGNLNMTFRVYPPGVLETVARQAPRLVVHFGAPVDIGCERGGFENRGVAIHRDVDIIPAGVRSQWTLGSRDSALVIGVSQGLVRQAATDLAMNPSEALLVNRFRVRDPKLEHLA